jgi:hypothetical protein
MALLVVLAAVAWVALVVATYVIGLKRRDWL